MERNIGKNPNAAKAGREDKAAEREQVSLGESGR